MKYIVMKVQMNKDAALEIPIIFPDILVHSDVAVSIKHMLALKHNWLDAKPISAGFLQSSGMEVSCHGKSETLGLSSRLGADTNLIKMADYGSMQK